MKILLVTDQLLSIEGNKIMGTVNFTNTLKRFSQLGEMHLCVRDASKLRNNILVRNDMVNEFVERKNISFIPKSFIWPSHKTLQILKREIKKADLIIGYVPSLNAEVASLLARRLGKKYFAFMVACPWDGLWNQDLKRKIAAPYRTILNKLTLKNADYALYVTTEFLQKRYPTHASKTLGLSDVVLEKTNEDVLISRISKIDSYSNNHTFKIATTAMLNVRYKGQRFVIKALSILKNKGICNFKYYLIGGGHNSALHRLAIKLGVADQVEFVGKVSHDQVFRLLDEIDIYVHPSLQEGLPRSVVEAMSRALPCIGSNTGAIPELIDKEYIVKRKSAYEIAEKLQSLTDPAIMKKEAVRNFNEAKKFECERLDDLRNNFIKSISEDFS